MKVIKRDGRAVDYDREKIAVAIEKANQEVKPRERATKQEIKDIIKYVEDLGKKRNFSRRYSRYYRRKINGNSKIWISKKIYCI